jgi:hypothetical protein
MDASAMPMIPTNPITSPNKKYAWIAATGGTK